MKARPRRTESSVAKHLSEYFSTFGLTPVERIPVLGRTGPDISINEAGLVIDVKSRLKVPKSCLVDKGRIARIGPYYGFRLEDIDLLYSGELHDHDLPASVQINDWFEHMDEWRRENFPMGTTALVLHRPGLRVASSTVVVDQLYKEYRWQDVTFKTWLSSQMTQPISSLFSKVEALS